ncbi:hypothetical protein Tco_0880715 [Tanacetum coccineum]
MWPVVESTIVIIPPNHKPQVGRPPKKRKKSLDEIASQSCSSGKLSRKGISVKNASSQATGSSQPSATPSTTTGARNASGENVGSSKPSAAPSTSSQVPSQHSSGPTQTYQRPRKGFQAPRLALSYGPQRLTKKIASRHNPRKFPSLFSYYVVIFEQ